MVNDKWIDVDRDGLRQILSRRPKSFVLTELIQNGWDENITRLDVDFRHVGRNTCELVVIDDSPEGFSDLADAYTMFKSSSKKDDPTKRGWINMGEKLVLALCRSAVIETTKGNVKFLDTGDRCVGRKKRASGSQVACVLEMSKADYDEACDVIPMLHVPSSITMTFNGIALEHAQPIEIIEATLPTLVANVDGDMQRTQRKTELWLYEPHERHVAHVYEMGIPVVETGDRFHYDVQQRVLLNTDRDNVTPGYLKKLRVLAFNHAHDKLATAAEANEGWAREATSDPECQQDSYKHAMDLRHGKKRVMRSPSDPESAGRAHSEGYYVLSGGSLSAGEHDNNRRFSATPSSSSLFPTPEVYSDDPNAKPEKIFTWEEMTDGMKVACRHSQEIALHLIDGSINVQVVSWPASVKFVACYGARTLRFNNRKLGKKFFDPLVEADPEAVDGLHHLVIHELAHDSVSNHLSHDFHEACCNLGAKLTRLALKHPHLFTKKHMARSF